MRDAAQLQLHLAQRYMVVRLCRTWCSAWPLEVILAPGEILYIPQYWWHHIENLTDECVSLNFWFKDQAKPQKVVLPLSSSQHLAMRRNIERLVSSKLGCTPPRSP